MTNPDALTEEQTTDEMLLAMGKLLTSGEDSEYETTSRMVPSVNGRFASLTMKPKSGNGSLQQHYVAFRGGRLVMISLLPVDGGTLDEAAVEFCDGLIATIAFDA